MDVMRDLRQGQLPKFGNVLGIAPWPVFFRQVLFFRQAVRIDLVRQLRIL